MNSIPAGNRMTGALKAFSQRPFFKRARSQRFLATSLLAGALVVTGLMPADAAAQRNNRNQNQQQSNQPSNTQGFVQAYRPAAVLVTGENSDWAGAKAAIPGIVAAIGNNVDRNVAGNFILSVGNQLQDNPLRRQGLELMLESGMTPAEQVPLFHYYVGTLAFNAEDYDESRSALSLALDAGYNDGDGEPNNDPLFIIVQTYFIENRDAEGISYVVSRADEMVARGDATAEAVVLRALQGAIDTEDTASANLLSGSIVDISPTDNNWKSALQVVNSVNDLSPQARLDLLRLMRLTGSLSNRSEYVRYIENADPRIMSNEVLPVLAEGIANDHFSASDPYYVEVKSIADTRAPIDRREIESNVRDARSDGGNVALSTGDVLYSLKDYARAEEIYKVALDTGADRDMALTRIGMSQVMQDKHGLAVETFAQVSGERTPVASMWSRFAQSRMPQSASLETATDALDAAAEAVEEAAQAVAAVN